jgi:hypothetical protein
MRTTMLKPSRHGIFAHAINAVGRRSGRIIEIEDIDSGERAHGTARRLERGAFAPRLQNQHAADSACALVRTHRFRHPGPMGLLPFGCSFRQLSPLERSHGQQGASTLGVGEIG